MFMGILKKVRQCHRVLGVMLLVFIIAGCASGPKSSKRVHFEKPREMATMIDFWINVYSKWDLNIVAFHDNRYLEVIYELSAVQQGDRMTWDTISEQIEQDLVIIEDAILNPRALTQQQERFKRMLLKAGGPEALIGASERLRGQRGLKSEFRKGLERSQVYIPYFKKTFKAAGLPEELAYIPHVESSFNRGARSKVGASGMWQFMPATARSFMPMRANVIDARFDPYHSAQGAAKLMAYNHKLVSYWPLTITAYNAGVGHSIRAKETYGKKMGVIVFNYSEGAFKFASRNFYAEFVAAMTIAKDPNKYFPGFQYQVVPSDIEGIQLIVPMSLRDLSAETGIPSSVLLELNPSWLRNIASNRADIPSNYDVWLPKGTMRNLKYRGFFRPSFIQP